MVQHAPRIVSGLLWAGLFSLAVSAVWAQENLAVPYSSLAAGQVSGIEEPLQRVVRNRSDWLALWRLHAAGRALPVPTVDFGRYMVVAIFAGESEARKVTIASITREPGRLVVRYALSGERPLSDGPTILASPFHIVRLARLQLPVEFLRMKRFPIVPKP